MKLEIKNVQHNETLSEETHCFSAKIYIDGVHAFNVSNHGHGGCNDVRPSGKCRLTEADVNAWLAANRPPDPEFPRLKHDLEIEVGDLVNRWLAAKALNKLLSKFLVSTDGKSLFTRKLATHSSATLTAADILGINIRLALKGESAVTRNDNYEMALALV